MFKENLVNNTDELNDNQGLIEGRTKPTPDSSCAKVCYDPDAHHFNRPATMVQMTRRGN